MHHTFLCPNSHMQCSIKKTMKKDKQNFTFNDNVRFCVIGLSDCSCTQGNLR